MSLWNAKTIGGILLVSGTTIGAGMLALPISVGLAGFYPSLLLFLIYWAYMTFTALLFLEVNLWMGPNANMITMVQHTLGRVGQGVAWAVYLFLLYSLTTAYLAVSGPIFLEAIQSVTGITISTWLSPLPLLAIFGFAVYRGTHAVDAFNRWLMIGMGVSFLLLTFGVIPHVQSSLIARIDWPYLVLGVSVVATSFGFHIIIPTLTTYLERNVNQLRRVILIGSFIPLCLYIFWLWLTLGVIPFGGPHGLLLGQIEGTDAAELVADILGHSWFAFVAHTFAFCAIVTSFLGVTLSLWDFLSDGLSIPRNGSGRWMLTLLTFAPPLAFTLFNPRAFLSAIEYAGAFGVVVLLGLFPALMVWVGRRKRNLAEQASYRAPGGDAALLAVMVLSLLVMIIECLHKVGVTQGWVYGG